MSFKKLDPSKIQITEGSVVKSVKNKYKGNVQFTINITNHVLERFAQRFLNNVQLNLEQIRDQLQQLIYDQGITGFAEGDQSYIALPSHGLFIIKHTKAVTFLGLNDINDYYRNIYIKLLNKGRVS